MSNGQELKLRHFVNLTKEEADTTEAQFERSGFAVSKEQQDSGTWSVAAAKCESE